ncbi:hypothetical protein ABZ504_14415, partial [Streptomyces mirabilis]|uniref:hypothetical protein n=1 Tax=Streptomyces mirabilis TaxID=68239 RepID=UPI0033EAA5AB
MRGRGLEPRQLLRGRGPLRRALRTGRTAEQVVAEGSDVSDASSGELFASAGFASSVSDLVSASV